MGEIVRRVRGGVVGTFTPLEVLLNFAENPELGEVGDLKTGLKVPAGKFVYGVYMRNADDDLESAGAGTVALYVDTTEELPAQQATALKGKGKAKIPEEALYVDKDSEVIVKIATANITKGKLAVGVIYG